MTLPAVNLKLIVLQLLVAILMPIWHLKLAHYFILPIPQLFSSPSAIPMSGQTPMKSLDEVDWRKTLSNILLFGVFFLQHYIMAAFRWKITSSKLWHMYPVYERLIYNLISSVLLLMVLEYQQPNTQILFTLPQWFCLPLAAIGFILFITSVIQIERPIFLPYNWSELFSTRQIKVDEDISQKKPEDKEKITIKGVYSMIRHPMLTGTLLQLIFGSHIFTFEKVVLVSAITVFTIIGTRMEERTMLQKNKQYEGYMNMVKSRYIPYVI